LEPPTHSREETLAWLGLTLVPGVTPRVQRALLEVFVTPQRIAAASQRSIAEVVGAGVADLLRAGPEAGLVERTLQWLERPGCRMLTMRDAQYPHLLLEISDPPGVLYTQGRVELLDARSLAIVGSRNATPQGARDAEAFARALSDAGLAIVSGLALGIDAAAHRGGIAGASSSVAVMGTGPDRVYPRRNRELALALAETGCLVSEFPLGTPAVPGNFPRRNRLISGMSRGVLVVEAGFPSGSLTTARLALDQGREVFAVPGSIHSPLSKGCHWLLKEGAKLAESAADVLEELRLPLPHPGVEPESAGVVPRDALLDAMGFGPVSIDQMAQRTELDAATLAAHLSRLEIAGALQALPGGWFQRVASRVIE
jgi:DNA processing protein